MASSIGKEGRQCASTGREVFPEKRVNMALESTVEALEFDVAGSVSEQSLWLPCVEDGGEFGKEPTKCYSDCKDSQREFSLHPQSNWEPDSDTLKKEPFIDLSQNEDTESPSFTAHPYDVNSHYHESMAQRSNCEGFFTDYPSIGTIEGNLLPSEIPHETCSVKRVDTCFDKEESRWDHGIEFDQSPGPSFATAGRENDTGTAAIGTLVCELQDKVAFFQDQCQELREELVKLKEKLKLYEDEKQDLQAEVGRQLFLESKERRCIKIYQPLNEHVSGKSMPGRVGGTSYNFSDLSKLVGGAGPVNKSEKLAVPFHNGDKSYRRESCSLQGNKQLNDVSENVSGVDDKQFYEVEERKDVYDNTESYGEDQFCNSSNVHPLNSEREVAAYTFHIKIVNESSFVGDEDLSRERCHSASSMFQPFNVPSIGVEYEERSLPPPVTGEQFESGEPKGACGAGDDRGREGSYESSPHDVTEGQLSYSDHFSDTEDGAVNVLNRAQDRLMVEDSTGVNQDSLPCGDKTQCQNGSCARIMVQKDKAIDQSDSHVDNQSNKWEHLGTRPRDRPPKTDTCQEPSLFYSLENLVPPQVAKPQAYGVANAFLARHSQDKNLHESLYYTNAEMMLTENSSLQGASHADGMMNLMDSTRAKLNFGDCQFSSRQDSHHQPHSSLFPQTGGAYIGGNNGLNTNFNLINPNIADDFAPCTRMQDGTSPFLQRDELLHSGFTVSGLTSYFMGSQADAFNMSNSNFSVNDYALGLREPQITWDGHFTSLQSNRPSHLGFNGSGLSFDLTGTTGHKMSYSATGNHRNSDFIGSASMLTLTTNPVLLGTSSVNMQAYDYHPDASPTAFSSTRVNGSDSRLLSGIESSGSSPLLSVTTGRDVLNTSSQDDFSSNAMDTFGDHLASAHYGEGSRAHNSSSSGLISGTNTGGSLNRQSGQNRDSVTNRNSGTESVESTDNSLLELEQRVEEACAMVERVLREREEREEFGREIERKERKIRAERARKKREREARELEEARGWPQQQEPVTGQSLWLCEHYQRHCRVRFPCCINFYSCHRCRNNSKECDNEKAKASHATHLKCSYCHHEQEERETGAEGVPCVVESVGTTHNSPQALSEGIEAAEARIQARSCRVRPQRP